MSYGKFPACLYFAGRQLHPDHCDFTVLGKPHISIFSTRKVICSFGGGGGGGELQL